MPSQPKTKSAKAPQPSAKAPRPPARRPGQWRWFALLIVVAGLGAGAWTQRDRLLDLVGASPEPPPKWYEIESMVQAARWADAERLLTRWVDANADDGRARLMLANLMAGRNAMDEARAVLRPIPVSNPMWETARVFEIDQAMRANRAPEAEALCRAALAENPDAVEPRRRLIFLLSVEQRTAEAREALWNLYRVVNDPRVLVDLVLESTKSEIDVRGTGPEVEAYLKVTPDDPFLRRARGMALLWAGDADAALPHLEAAARALVDDPLGRFALAECRLQLGKTVRVPDDLGPEPTTGTPADRARWWVFRGRLEETQGRFPGAMASFREAVALAPAAYEPRFRLTDALSRAKDPTAEAERAEAERLRTLWNQVRRRYTDLRSHGFKADAGLFEQLAEECVTVGLAREAEAWLGETLELEPNRKSASALLAELKPDEVPFPVPLSRPRKAEAVASASASPVEQTASVPKATEGSSPGRVRLEDLAAQRGISYTYDHGPREDLYLADTMGGGVALIDYDQDGWLDIYFVNGCRFPFDSADPPRPNRLYRNLGDGTFTDVTTEAGVAGLGYGMGAAVADYDNDGDPDLFVTGYGQTLLYRNNGDGTFTDVTESAGVGSDRWSTAAAFADLDDDGDLDLFVVTYVEDDGAPRPCRDHAGKTIHCSPAKYEAQEDQLFRNNGDGTFADVSEEAGIAPMPQGRGLGLAVADLDDDGRLDLYVANDASADFHFRNLGGLRFEEIGASSGLAFDGSGQATASMGVVADDLNADGRIDLFHTNFLNEPNTLALNLGAGQFFDGTLAAGLSASSLSRTGFGAAAPDFDNDGHYDLFIANGHVDDQVWVGSPMAQLPQIYLGEGDGQYLPADAEQTPYLARPVVGRGAAMGDLDNDGRLDLVVVHRGSPTSVLFNRTEGGHWIGIEIEQEPGQAMPFGARISVTAGGKTQTRWSTPGTGYLSVHDPRLHFGLGSAARVDRVEIVWPDGSRTQWNSVALDRYYHVRARSDRLE